MTVRKEAGSSKDTWHAWDDLYRRQPRAWKGPAEDLQIEGVPGIALELGCGSGKTLLSLGAKRIVLAFDVSRAALIACRGDRRSENVELIQGDAMRLPFASESLDIVVAHHILGHLLSDERKAAATEIARVLRPDRLLSIRVLAQGDMRAWGRKEVEPMTFAKGGVISHFFDEAEIKSLFPSFDVVRIGTTSLARRYGGVEMKRSEVIALLRSPA